MGGVVTSVWELWRWDRALRVPHGCRLSVGSDTCLMRAAKLVAAMRQCSMNRDIAILIGGPVLLEDPELAVRVGADATAMDCQQTVRWVEDTWRRHRGHAG